MTIELKVSLHGALCGHLIELDDGRWSFVYAEDAFERQREAPLSLALPTAQTAHFGQPVLAYFSNLLPDGSLRRRLAQSLGFSEGNDFALLGRLGRECVGAVSVSTIGEATVPIDPMRELAADQLRNLVAVLPLHPLLADAEGISKSLPGEFDKLPLRIADGRIQLLFDDSLTSHIVKPSKPRLKESVHNEAWCMGLAGAWGLPVAATSLLPGNVNLLAVERLDRVHGEQPAALQMEDFCQILSVLPGLKYEREGGPRLADIARTLRRTSVRPARDLQSLINWAIFSFLIGFGAGHAKQIALLHGPNGPYLAPFYGLWSTHIYAEMNFRMGYSIGGEDRPDWLTAQRWREFAVEIGVRPRYVLDRLRQLASELPALARAHSDDFQRRFGYVEVVPKMRNLLAQRCRQALVSLEAEP